MLYQICGSERMTSFVTSLVVVPQLKFSPHTSRKPLFVHEFEGEGVGVALVVEEILNTEEPGVGSELAAVPLYMEAEGSEGGMLPDVDGTGNLGVVASGCNLVGRMVDVVEEESATVVVGLEHLEGGGEVATVEVVHFLNVGLSFGSDECQHQGCNEYYFFHIDTFLVDNN